MIKNMFVYMDVILAGFSLEGKNSFLCVGLEIPSIIESQQLWNPKPGSISLIAL